MKSRIFFQTFIAYIFVTFLGKAYNIFEKLNVMCYQTVRNFLFKQVCYNNKVILFVYWCPSFTAYYLNEHAQIIYSITQFFQKSFRLHVTVLMVCLNEDSEINEMRVNIFRDVYLTNDLFK